MLATMPQSGLVRLGEVLALPPRLRAEVDIPTLAANIRRETGASQCWINTHSHITLQYTAKNDGFKGNPVVALAHYHELLRRVCRVPFEVLEADYQHVASPFPPLFTIKFRLEVE